MTKAIKEPIVTAVATLKITVDALGMGAQSWRADKVTKSPDSGPLKYGVDVLLEMRELVEMTTQCP